MSAALAARATLADLAAVPGKAELIRGQVVPAMPTTVAGTVSRYRPGDAAPTSFGPGQDADTEPAVPGWLLSVDRLMR